MILLIIVISIPDENKSTEAVLFTVFYMDNTKALDNLMNKNAIALGNTVLLSHLAVCDAYQGFWIPKPIKSLPHLCNLSNIICH